MRDTSSQRPRPRTRIAKSTPDRITIRGVDLVDELIGQRDFTEMLYFLVVQRWPTKKQRQILDACLVTLMEHGLTPGALITKLTADSVPGEIQVAIASGLMAIGSRYAGTSEGCAALLQQIAADKGDKRDLCRAAVAEHQARRAAVPGFGHPVHKPEDPRAQRLIQLARELAQEGPYIDLLLMLGEEVDRAYGKHLPVNATGAIGALLLAIGIPVDLMRAITVVSRAGGLIGHVAEEREGHAARLLVQSIDSVIPYDDSDDGMSRKETE